MNLTDDARAASELADALATRDPEVIARAIAGNIWPLYCSRYAELTTVIESLPPSTLDRYPVLRVVHRMTPVLARTTRPFKPLVYPEHARSMSDDELDILTLAQMIAFRFSGDVAAAVIYARRLLDRIDGSCTPSDVEEDGPRWYYHHQIGTTLLAAGDTSGALVQFERARHIGSRSTRPDAERMVWGRLALTHAVRGSLDEAELALTRTSELPAVTAAHLASVSTTERTARALVDVERLDVDLDDRIALLEPYDSVEVTWPFALLARTRALLSRHRPDEALEAIRLAQGAHPEQHGSFASDVIAAASIDAFTAGGDSVSARHAARSHAPVGILSRLAIARHSLVLSHLDRARSVLQPLERATEMGPGPRLEVALLTAWLQRATSGHVTPRVAAQISQLATGGRADRILTSIPAYAVEQISDLLPDGARDPVQDGSGTTATETTPVPVLTPSELRVLRALSTHPSITEMASALHVSPNTIKSQLRTLYRKLGCANRSDVVKTAIRLRLISAASE